MHKRRAFIITGLAAAVSLMAVPAIADEHDQKVITYAFQQESNDYRDSRSDARENRQLKRTERQAKQAERKSKRAEHQAKRRVHQARHKYRNNEDGGSQNRERNRSGR